MDASDLDPAVDYIFTIGHSNMSFDALLANLRAYGIEAVADVRSQPISRYTPHFNRSELPWQLQEAGIRYAFMGDTLGGRPNGSAYYDDEGHVRYDIWSASNAFASGIEKLTAAALRRRVAVLCSEEDPAACHRHLLIARVLDDGGWPQSRIVHIRGDASCITDEVLALARYISDEEAGWRSPRSVSRGVRQRASSRAYAAPESDDW